MWLKSIREWDDNQSCTGHWSLNTRCEGTIRWSTWDWTFSIFSIEFLKKKALFWRIRLKKCQKSSSRYPCGLFWRRVKCTQDKIDCVQHGVPTKQVWIRHYVWVLQTRGHLQSKNVQPVNGQLCDRPTRAAFSLAAEYQRLWQSPRWYSSTQLRWENLPQLE